MGERRTSTRPYGRDRVTYMEINSTYKDRREEIRKDKLKRNKKEIEMKTQYLVIPQHYGR